MKNRYKEIFKDHVMLSGKMQGATKELTGKIVVIVFFINDNESRWSQTDIQKYQKTHDEGMRSLMRQARESGANLHLVTASCTLDVNMVCTSDNTTEWIKAALSCYRKEMAVDYQQYYEAKYGYDEAPIIFAFNKEFRCYAMSASDKRPTAEECSVVCRDSIKESIMHELLHQFGAPDYYYPADVEEAATKYFPPSVMQYYDCEDVDDLTKYVIGWTDEIPDNAALFLLNTQHHTQESINEAIAREWGK